MTLTVGQKLWYVPGERLGAPSAVTVTKVGRVWAEFDGGRGGRCEIAGMMRVDGGAYGWNGRCYISKREHELAGRRKRLTVTLARHLDHTVLTCPPEAFYQAAKILGISEQDFGQDAEGEE